MRLLVPALAVIAVLVPTIRGRAQAVSAAAAQTLEPRFEVASLKRSGPDSMRGSEYDPGRYTFGSATLTDLFYVAYSLKDTAQLEGPGWLSQDKFDLTATIPAGVPRSELPVMLQALLVERFHVTLHRVSREFAVYDLAVAKGGPKFAVSRPDYAVPAGYPELPTGKAGLSIRYEGGHARLAARDEDIAALATMLQSTAGRLIVDKTGLAARYDFTLEFSPNGAPADDLGPLPIFNALPIQLGLTLTASKAALEAVVIDHIEKLGPVKP